MTNASYVLESAACIRTEVFGDFCTDSLRRYERSYCINHDHPSIIHTFMKDPSVFEHIKDNAKKVDNNFEIVLHVDKGGDSRPEDYKVIIFLEDNKINDSYTFEKIERPSCRDGGTCNHNCKSQSECYRERNCAPFSNYASWADVN